jgi:hypothetical protein
MSGSRQKVVVSRIYRAVPDDCARALEFLLKASESKKAAGQAASNDAKVRYEDDSRAMGGIP